MMKLTKSQWLSWIILFICILVLVFFVYGIYLYYTVQKNKQAQLGDIETTFLNQTLLTEVDEVYPFYDQDTYYIAFGTTDDDEKKIIFMPESEEMDEIIIDESEIMSKEDALDSIISQCSHCDIKQIKPAMIDQTPLWEITYRDEHDRFTFEYISIYDGTRYELLQFKQMFK